MTLAIPKTSVLDNAFLEKVWKQYYTNQKVSTTWMFVHQNRPYKPGVSHVHKNFENWLWKHGCIIQKINGKYCMKFIGEDSATFFSLKYG